VLNTAWARRGMVTSPHHLASRAGLDVLRAGGTAVEAAVAVAATLAVVYPHMTGLGGDGFWLIAEPDAQPVAIDASGGAALASTPDFYREHGHAAIPIRGPLAANTVAGTVSGWTEALAHTAGWQTPLPLERVLVTRNRASEGLGLALPAGKVALYGRRDGHRILLGEGTIDDHAVGEKVEIAVATPTGVNAHQVTTGYDSDRRAAYRLTLTSDLAHSQRVEIELPLVAKAAPGTLTKRDGWWLWNPTIPPNGTVTLEYHY